ncbi:MAG: PilN domain-containing protein, partial [Pseudomonadota bacterium]
LIAAGVYVSYATRIATQQQRNETLQVAIKKLEAEIKDIATLQQEIAGLKARQQAVEDLQADRNMPVHLLNELVRQVPDGIFLTSVRQDGQRVTLGGVAQSNERVSEFLRNLSHNSPWLAQPELIEIVASSMDVSPRDRRRVANFNIRVRILRASEAQKPVPAVSTPAKS